MRRYNFTKGITNVIGAHKPGVSRRPGAYRDRREPKLDRGYLFDGVNDYGYSSHYYGGCVEVKNDGTRNYLNATGYGGFIACTDASQEFGVNSRSVQTIKFVGTIENLLASMTLFSYSGYTSISVITSGQIQVELQGTGSIRINSTTTLTPNTIYNIIIRINNSLSTGTGRVVTDADIFINGVKDTKGSSGVSTNTVTGSFIYGGGYNSTTNLRLGKIYSLTLWNRALSDGECASEGASNFSIVNTDYLRTRNADNTSRILGRSAPNYGTSGNIKLTTDGDGECFLCKGSADGSPGVGSVANMSTTMTSYLNETKSFTMKVKCKVISMVTTQSGGLFGSNFDIGFQCTVSGIQFGVRSGTTATSTMGITLGQVYELFLDYDANTQKFYAYNGTTLLNAGGTSIPGPFTINDLHVGDNGILGGNPFSNEKKIYHARIYGKILSSAEKLADMALGNTIPNDPLILYEIRPEGRKDVQLLSNIDDLTAAGWSKGVNTTLTQNYGADPDGNNLTTRVQFSSAGTLSDNLIHQAVTTGTMGLGGAELASKVMQIRCFMRSSVAGQKIRLKMSHTGVADYYTGDQILTTEWKEYTLNQTFTGATNGTGITAGIVRASDGSASDFEVRWPKSFFTTENVYDYSCSIGHVGRFSSVAYEVVVKPNIDALDTASSQAILMTPWRYIQLRSANNNIQFRRETKRNANSPAYSLGVGRRSKVHILCVAYLDIPTSNFVHEIRVEGELKSTHQSKYINPSSYYSSLTIGSYSGGYYSGGICNVKGYLGSLTTSEKQNCCKGYEPLNALKFLDLGPSRSEGSDKSTINLNNSKRMLTLVNGVNRGYI